MTARETLEQELKKLRKGRGVFGDNIAQRVGPELGRLCGIQDGDDESEIRRKLALRLSELSTHLPEDLRLAFLAALSLHPDTQQRFLDERIEWLASRLHRDVRTARRRVDEAISLATDTACNMRRGQPTSGPNDNYAPGGWHLASFRVLLRMNQATPEATEEREIVAAMDGLQRVLISAGIPRHPASLNVEHGLKAELLYGGHLSSQDRPADTYFRYFVQLPYSLNWGERHRIGTRMTIPPGQLMYPRYVYRPLRDCDSFELRIKFDRKELPRRIWQVAAIPSAMLDDFTAKTHLVAPDRFGELTLEFHSLRPGLSYGAKWED